MRDRQQVVFVTFDLINYSTNIDSKLFLHARARERIFFWWLTTASSDKRKRVFLIAEARRQKLKKNRLMLFFQLSIQVRRRQIQQLLVLKQFYFKFVNVLS